MSIGVNGNGHARRLFKVKHSVLSILICIIFIELFVFSIRVHMTKKMVGSRAGGKESLRALNYDA